MYVSLSCLNDSHIADVITRLNIYKFLSMHGIFRFCKQTMNNRYLEANYHY